MRRSFSTLKRSKAAKLGPKSESMWNNIRRHVRGGRTSKGKTSRYAQYMHIGRF
jgi:hypothetical protein